MPFLDSLDIANRALQHCGQTQIVSPTEDSKNNLETAFAYDKVRRAELRRNDWRFAIRKAVLRAVDTGTMLLHPAAYDSTVTYQAGAIVADTNNQLWLSMAEGNRNNAPGGNDEIWDMYFGPLTIEPYDTTGSTNYWTGELVYKPGVNPGSYNIFMSLENANTDVPDTATVWSSTVTYHGNDTVSYSGSQWRSLIEVNLNVVPADGPLPYDAGTTYAATNTVTGSDHFIYSSVGSGNIGNDPTTDAGVHWTNTGVPNAWSRSPAVGVSSTNWRLINATMTTLQFSYPIGSGPQSQSDTRNVFRLPAGYLREAPQDPKAGSVTVAGAPSGLMYEDWDFEGNYIVSRDTGPFMFRFIADVTKVSAMDDMFCEGLALTIALAIARPLTNSAELIQTCASEYKLRMGEARTVNAIEVGPVEPPVDDWISCRT